MTGVAVLAVASLVGLTPPPDRPMEAWVFRSVLDKHARMVTCALSQDLWVAYDATNCGIYKVWKGGVKFDGAVYTTQHGPQPTSEGAAYAQWNPEHAAWVVSEAGKKVGVKPRYRGYRFMDGRVWFRFEFGLGPQRQVTVWESPEHHTEKRAFERKFQVSGLPSGFQLMAVMPGRDWNSIAATGDVLIRFARDESTLEFSKNGEGAVTAVLPVLPEPKPQPGRQEEQLEPGLALRLFSSGKALSQIPRLVPNQSPNVNKVVATVNLSTKDDWGGFDQRFYAELTGFLKIDKGGDYSIGTSSDDGSRVFLNGKLIVDNDGLHSEEMKYAMVRLDPGLHPIRVEYFQEAGDAVLRLGWLPPGATTPSVVPAENLRTRSGEVKVTAPGDKLFLEAIDWSTPGDGRPLEGVHPAFKLEQARPDDWHVRVGGIDFLPDGRMVVCAWEPDGGVYIVSGHETGDPKKMSVKRFAIGLAEPLGIKVVRGQVYVLQKQELTRLIDHDLDGVADEYEALANGWGVTDNFHEFAFGLVHHKGHFYATLAIAIDPGGGSTKNQNPDRGKVVKINDRTGSYELIAGGLRTPNGIGFGSRGRIYVADNQGDWLPSSKIVLVEPGAFWGNRSVEVGSTTPETPPVAWLPQGEIGNSPSQPAPLDLGPYKGQMMHGDVTHGGLKRMFVEWIDGRPQGCVFRFTQGLEAGVNRVMVGPGGAIYVGGIGSTGNWGQEGKQRFGLQRLVWNGAVPFEMLKVEAKTNGLLVTLTEPLAKGAGANPSDYRLEQWRYEPTAAYGGPKIDQERVTVKSVTVLGDRSRVFIEAPGIKAGHVVHLRLDGSLLSATGRRLWSTEAWYTMNRIPRGRSMAAKPDPDARPGENMLTPSEIRAGFTHLFDGESLGAWKGFRQATVPNGWAIIDGSLAYTPGVGGGDISTREQFGDFELRLQWRVSEGGNSGVFYRVSESSEAPWDTGMEMQVLDDARHRDARSRLTAAGSLYGLIPAPAGVVRPAGVWNDVRIIAKGSKFEHWLNGVKLLEFDTASEDFRSKVAASKFAALPGFAKERRGHILLQDHGDPVQYRNIRIRMLD
ncbi:MAG: DUF1080 domain-containing protein [Fimbriimonadaceae bacterium]|nr:DUF1080 domain-containing protein [Fimbriimonadaceae bacterium]QYK58801.1 MAG: DUF1080 domain-containing protein [Fimbriimonadaceae bacterium]